MSGGRSSHETAATVEQSLRPIGNINKCITICELHVALKIPYVCHYITRQETGRNNPVI
jgi:hypothetical protein